ncbi:TetR/AcrR family transcriptional regulator [Mycobacterium manitobense]|uniref:TetR/AcrR family transcriptional regulator n=1 Tax=[Mycobacterium] manitobense TaxID=190147 RepID=A0A9X3BWE9_9MYCO|nr:TetR/AcrR family transcriptional regulator [[Mycobacterium] manitobense]MCV7171646.1 TetR/AcrR family transcriptional regulator [[Mycobacterium] manitobense]
MRRRHGEELDAAIRSAALRLLADHGPAGVTMEAVAAEAKTSKPVLYRRWPDAAALIRDTLVNLATTAIPHHDTGSYRTDMLAVLGGWAALFTGPDAAVLRAAVAAATHDPVLTDTLQRDVIGWRKAEMAALLRRGVERGDVRPDVPVELARELGQSVLWHRLLITGDPITDDLVVQLVDEVLVPFVAPRAVAS